MTSQHTNEETPTPDRSPVVFMLSTIADTTWRMFIPTIGFTFLGWIADKQWATKPWLFILGIIIGATISALLVRRQLINPKKS